MSFSLSDEQQAAVEKIQQMLNARQDGSQSSAHAMAVVPRKSGYMPMPVPYAEGLAMASYTPAKYTPPSAPVQGPKMIHGPAGGSGGARAVDGDAEHDKAMKLAESIQKTLVFRKEQNDALKTEIEELRAENERLSNELQKSQAEVNKSKRGDQVTQRLRDEVNTLTAEVQDKTRLVSRFRLAYRNAMKRIDAFKDKTRDPLVKLMQDAGFPADDKVGDDDQQDEELDLSIDTA